MSLVIYISLCGQIRPYQLQIERNKSIALVRPRDERISPQPFNLNFIIGSEARREAIKRLLIPSIQDASNGDLDRQ